MENAKEMLVATGQLRLKVTPRARNTGVGELERDADGLAYLPVKVRAVAEGGKANAAVIDAIAETFGIPKSRLAITRGSTSRYKTITCRRG